MHTHQPHPLTELAQVGDPLADAVITTLAEHNALRGDIATQIAQFAEPRNAALRDWKEVTQSVPAWVDWEQIEHGRRLFLCHAPSAVAVFVLGSLLQTYAPPGNARVLLHTGRLRQDVLRRLYETATMVSAVLTPHGMQAGGLGHQAVLRVRLLHARVRHHVLHSGHWPRETLGCPINQLQMGLTGLGFSLHIVRGLQDLGIGLDADAQQSYQHLWRFANWLQGVDPVLQADSLAGEAQLHQVLGPLMLTPDDNSRVLVDAVHQHLGGQAPFFLPSRGLQAISRRLLGPELAQAYQLPEARGWRAALAVVQGVNQVASLRRWVPGLSLLEEQVGAFYFHRLIAYGLAQQPADYGFKSAS